MVIADKAGEPIVPVEEIQRQIRAAIEIFRQCNVNVVASRVVVITGKSHLAVGPSCDADGFASQHKLEYENLSCCNGLLDSVRCLRFPSGLIWPRHILKAIWLDDVPGKAGCYLFPNSYVQIDKTATINILAHEMGHACDLTHRDDQNNLMHSDATHTELTDFQCCTIRTGRFVTYF